MIQSPPSRPTALQLTPPLPEKTCGQAVAFFASQCFFMWGRKGFVMSKMLRPIPSPGALNFGGHQKRLGGHNGSHKQLGTSSIGHIPQISLHLFQTCSLRMVELIWISDDPFFPGLPQNALQYIWVCSNLGRKNLYLISWSCWLLTICHICAWVLLRLLLRMVIPNN